MVCVSLCAGMLNHMARSDQEVQIRESTRLVPNGEGSPGRTCFALPVLVVDERRRFLSYRGKQHGDQAVLSEPKLADACHLSTFGFVKYDITVDSCLVRSG